MAATFTYDDPQMVHVGAFTNSEGLNRIAQKGATYYHFTDRKPRPGDDLDYRSSSGLMPVRMAIITRDGPDVSYNIQYGPPTPAATLQGVTAALPADMRRKKFVIKGNTTNQDPGKV